MRFSELIDKAEKKVDELNQDCQNNYIYFKRIFGEYAKLYYWNNEMYRGLYAFYDVIPFFPSKQDFLDPINGGISYYKPLVENNTFFNIFYMWIEFPFLQSEEFRKSLAIHEFGHLLSNLLKIKQFEKESLSTIQAAQIINHNIYDNQFYQCCNQIQPQFKEYEEDIWKKLKTNIIGWSISYLKKYNL